MDTQLATSPAPQPPQPFVKASTQLGHFLGMETGALIDTLKSQFFKNLRPEQVSDAQLATVIAVANALKLNPLLPGQLYPYPERSGGVSIMLGPDGIYTLLSNNPDIVATKDGGAAWWTEHALVDGKETCTGYINHRTKGLLKKTIWVDEWVVSSNPNWNARRHHMSETRALKQVARMVIHGLPADSDEHKLSEMLNVTESAEDAAPAPKVERRAAPAKAKGVAAVVEPTPPPTQEKARDVAIDVQATTVAESLPKPEPGTKAAEISNEADFDAVEEVALRTTLNVGEKITGKFKIVSFTPVKRAQGGRPVYCVDALVEGEYAGKATHIGGGVSSGNDVLAGEHYAVGATVTMTLLGAARKDGSVGVLIESIAP